MPLNAETTAPAARVKAHAHELGFDACGVAAASPIDQDDRLGVWLSKGYHAGMDWLARTKTVRQHIEQWLPGVRSVVVVARNYYAPRPEAGEGTGRVSRYAWGRDYHRVLRKPVKRLADFIATLEPAAQSALSIDSGPVLEKFWAARAGLGWLGKNGLLVNKEYGSWVFLGVIATTVELEPDAPVPDQCGECRACLDACPTGALVEPRVLDANRCISYHTIENRGEVPEDVRRRFGDWLFGCDLCQEVCPWNRQAQVTSEPDFFPRDGNANPHLDEWDEMDDEMFRVRFSGTPLMRAKRAGMVRNARIARENRPNP